MSAPDVDPAILQAFRDLWQWAADPDHSLTPAKAAEVAARVTQRIRDETVAAIGANYADVFGDVSKVYDHITGGRASKPNIIASQVIAEADDLATKEQEEAIAEAVAAERANYEGAMADLHALVEVARGAVAAEYVESLGLFLNVKYPKEADRG